MCEKITQDWKYAVKFTNKKNHYISESQVGICKIKIKPDQRGIILYQTAIYYIVVYTLFYIPS